jgi:hypothetical protein
MDAYQKAFFWIYNFALLAIAVFIVWLGWRVLAVRRQYPRPRREITWS